MSRIVRGQLALDTGDRLKDIAGKVLRLHEYSGEALEAQLRSLDVGLAAAVANLDTIVRSCRAGKNSYPNYPALRLALGDAGDAVYEIRNQIAEFHTQLRLDIDHQHFSAIGRGLLEYSQKLRLVSFVPPEGGAKQAQA